MKNRGKRYGGLIGLFLAVLTISIGQDVKASPCDPDRGASVANKCVACHVLNSEKNKVGPGLLNVVGRKAASSPGFRYSRTLSALDIAWTPENLDQFLKSPQKFAPGTAMAFGGVKNDEDRADLICFLAGKK